MKKRITAAVLSVLMLLLCGVPAAFAEGDSGLTEAVLLAKERLEIPEECSEFSSSVSRQGDVTYYRLNWRTPDDKEPYGYVNATVSSFGDITSYSKSLSENRDEQPRLSSLTADEVRETGKAWVEKVNPAWTNELNFDVEPYMGNVRYDDAGITFTREVNGIPFSGEYISLSLDKRSGEIISVYSNWSYPKEIPSPEGVISPEEAEAGRMEASGMTLRYIRKSNSEDAILVYQPEDRSIWIDAFSGEEFTMEAADVYETTADMAMENMKAEEASMGADLRLTEQEISEISRMDSLISEEKALEIVKALPNTGLSEFEIARSSYSKIMSEWEKDRYEVSLRLENEEADGSAYVTLDAESGQLLSLSAYTYREMAEEKEVISGEELFPKAEAFAKEVASDVYGETKLFDEITEDTSRFLFRQSVDGVRYDGNYVSVSVDPYTGLVTGFGRNWDEMNFEPKEGVMTPEEAGQVLFEKIGLSLEYRKIQTKNTPEVALVYVIKGGANAIGAKDGKLLDASGEAYDPLMGELVMPADISGHYAGDMIEALFVNNVLYLPEGENAFRPDDQITQEEALEFLSAFGSMPYSKPFDPELAYNGAISRNIMDASEKNPAALVSREEAVQYIVRALGYREVAELQEIYRVGFPDASEITGGREGYVALAKGLGIVQGDTEGNFNPKNIVTRGEFAVMVYNYLTR